MATKAIKIPDNMNLLSPSQKLAIHEETPKEYVKVREGRMGRSFKYVETGYVIKRLNEVFNHLWSFEIVEENIYMKANHISVKGQLTVHIGPELSVSKTQYGGADIKLSKKTRKPLSISDDKKAAASDALKKCASLFGIASDVYWGGESDEVEYQEAEENVLESNTEPVDFAQPSGFIATPEGAKASRKYFAVAKQAGYAAMQAKTIAKNKYKLESYSDIKEVQLRPLIKAMEMKAEEKMLEEEPITELFDGGLDV